jgi:hypothetical protein
MRRGKTHTLELMARDKRSLSSCDIAETGRPKRTDSFQKLGCWVQVNTRSIRESFAGRRNECPVMQAVGGRGMKPAGMMVFQDLAHGSRRCVYSPQ